MSFDNSVPEIEAVIGYTFSDKALLRQAFTRASFCNEHAAEGYSSNEVLEFFGDSALSLAIVTRLIEDKTARYRHGVRSELTEGDFSNVRSHLADKKNLSEAISRLGLERYLIVGEGDEKLGIRTERSVMEDLFEAIIGAVYIDSGFSLPAVIRTVERMIDVTHYMQRATAAAKNAKNTLQEWCADRSRRLPPPVYKKIAESGPDHNKLYTSVCIVNGHEVGRGEARNLRISEQIAAQAALATLGIKNE